MAVWVRLRHPARGADRQPYRLTGDGPYYDFEHAHAKLTYNHPFKMATGPTSVESLQRLGALQVQCGVERLR